LQEKKTAVLMHRIIYFFTEEALTTGSTIRQVILTSITLITTVILTITGYALIPQEMAKGWAISLHQQIILP
jgi:uncharacterized membrane protein